MHAKAGRRRTLLFRFPARHIRLNNIVSELQTKEPLRSGLALCTLCLALWRLIS